MFFLLAWRDESGAKVPRVVAHAEDRKHLDVHAERFGSAELTVEERAPLDANKVPFAEQHAHRWDPAPTPPKG